MQEFDDRVSNAVCVEVEGANGFWSSKRFTNIFLLPIGILSGTKIYSWSSTREIPSLNHLNHPCSVFVFLCWFSWPLSNLVSDSFFVHILAQVPVSDWLYWAHIRLLGILVTNWSNTFFCNHGSKIENFPRGRRVLTSQCKSKIKCYTLLYKNTREAPLFFFFFSKTFWYTSSLAFCRTLEANSLELLF
jgi:hypothetical protein